MTHEMIDRTLWYEAQNGRVELPQADLRKRTEPLVVLGEAGMGKSRLLEWLATAPGYIRCTARKLIRSYDPQIILGDAQILVVDALDEVSARKEGEAVDLVLRQLDRLGCPRFVLSCRVADWRSATGLEAIREQYEEEPLELHLEPLNDDDAVAFLSGTLGAEFARAVAGHFSERGLDGLLGNPQTLELIARVAKTGRLPETQSELFERAIEVLRVEHRDTRALSQPARQTTLGAAGAAFAGLILTGSEAIVRTAEANIAEGELQLADITCLPDGEAVAAMLGTRLFRADGADRFTYLHRRIGEFLGARWLAKLADTRRKRRRLLWLFHSSGLVPASLRGIHAWLARDPALAQAVIAADPMGVIEYGDADVLTVEQARSMLRALELLAADNPHFCVWRRYWARGIAQPELVEEVRRLIAAPETAFGLRFFLIQAIKGTKIVPGLVNELRLLVLDTEAIFASRSAAAEALVGSAGEEDWPAIVRTLHEYSDAPSVRLGIEITGHIGYEPFHDDLIVDLLVAYATDDNPKFGVPPDLERRLPESRVAGILDRLAEIAGTLGKRDERPANDDLTDFARHLIVRRVAAGGVSAENLWYWLEPFEAEAGYQHETREQLDALIRNDDSLRRAVQRLVLLEQPGDHDVRRRASWLQERSSAFAPTTGDIIALLEVLDPVDRSDGRWREVIQLVQHEGEVGAEVRAAARFFAAHRADLLEWLDKLAEPHVFEWQIKQAERERTQRAKQATAQAEHRKYFAAQIEQMRAGHVGALIAPAQAYLKLRRDIGQGVPAHERVAQWLGQSLGEAAHLGFEAFLVLDPAKPTADEIAEGVAHGQHQEAGYIIVAALAERLRKGAGLEDVSDERLMAGLFELRHGQIDKRAGIKGLARTIEAAVQARGIWADAMRRYHEPQLKARREYIHGLSALMQDDAHAALGTKLAAEWLDRFPEIPATFETELIDRLIRSGRHKELRHAATSRANVADDERRRNWDAVGVIVDFERTVARLEASMIEPELLWHLLNRTGGRFGHRAHVALSPVQLEWIVATFRPLWPMAERPRGITTGDTNPWDAAEHIARLIHRVGNNSSEEASVALERLRDAPTDGYTETVQIVAAEQARIRAEAAYRPPTLEAINALARDKAPVTAADLQAFMIEELAVVQAKIKSDDVESWRGFYDENRVPFAEERCRDHLLGLLRQGCEGITLDPETHVAADKEVDITCTAGALRMPIEVKGQWHRELWHGADTQLDRLYTQDWRADGRGIYLVLWFGDKQRLNKSLASPGRGVGTPRTPDELRVMLDARSRAAREERVVVVVLDLER